MHISPLWRLLPPLGCFTLDLFHLHHCRLFASGSYPYAHLRNPILLPVPICPNCFLAPLFPWQFHQSILLNLSTFISPLTTWMLYPKRSLLFYRFVQARYSVTSYLQFWSDSFCSFKTHTGSRHTSSNYSSSSLSWKELAHLLTYKVNHQPFCKIIFFNLI